MLAWLCIDPQQPSASAGELKWSRLNHTIINQDGLSVYLCICWQRCDGVDHVLLHWWKRESTLTFVSIPKDHLLCFVLRDVSVVRVGTAVPDASCSFGNLQQCRSWQVNSAVCWCGLPVAALFPRKSGFGCHVHCWHLLTLGSSDFGPSVGARRVCHIDLPTS